MEICEEEKFAAILSLDNISYAELCLSLDPWKNRKKVFKAGEGAGASGSFFFFSDDNKFIIKTLQAEEKDTILTMMDDYLQHLR